MHGSVAWLPADSHPQLNGERGGFLGYAMWRRYLKIAHCYTAAHPDGIDRSRITVSDYLDEWLEATPWRSSPKTLQDYRHLITRHVNPLARSAGAVWYAVHGKLTRWQRVSQSDHCQLGTSLSSQQDIHAAQTKRLRSPQRYHAGPAATGLPEYPSIRAGFPGTSAASERASAVLRRPTPPCRHAQPLPLRAAPGSPACTTSRPRGPHRRSDQPVLVHAVAAPQRDVPDRRLCHHVPAHPARQYGRRAPARLPQPVRPVLAIPGRDAYGR